LRHGATERGHRVHNAQSHPCSSPAAIAARD
jgi:hypothetical protein